METTLEIGVRAGDDGPVTGGLPRVPGGLIAGRCLPSGGEVGGDWYDAMLLDDGRLAIVMGDVAGHGIGAAALKWRLGHATRALALEGLSPAVVLDRLDRLVGGLEGGPMATVICMVVEPDLRSVRLASAGHLPALVVGADGRGRFLEHAPHPPLGALDVPRYAEHAYALGPGATLVLYTDGLVEVRDAPLVERLEQLRLAAEHCDDLEELCDRLLAEMVGTRPSHDDIAILALRALPSA
jgi:serine phosphatase RsbU (regulator of sigma subunit)